MTERPHHRRSGILYRPAPLGRPRHDPVVIDGGEDAPLSPRGRRVYISVLLAGFVVFVALMILSAYGS